MHPNPVYRQPSRAQNIDFTRMQGFGMLCIGTQGVPLVSHIPFLLSEDGQVAEFHLVRSNPIVRLLKSSQQARLAVQGPHSYVSPDWYYVEDQVPTWNYVAIHLLGKVELRPIEELRNLLDRQSALYETQLRPKSPWTAAKMTVDALDRMMRQIVPCQMRVEDIQGTWKLNQNKPPEVQERAAQAIGTHGIGQEVAALAALMPHSIDE